MFSFHLLIQDFSIQYGFRIQELTIRFELGHGDVAEIFCITAPDLSAVFATVI
jgi:hypothetical protein